VAEEGLWVGATSGLGSRRSANGGENGEVWEQAGDPHENNRAPAQRERRALGCCGALWGPHCVSRAVPDAGEVHALAGRVGESLVSVAIAAR
jgi:hypothetical protein